MEMSIDMLSPLATFAGQWIGHNTLHDPNTNQPETTDSTLSLTPLLNGRFIRIDYTWHYQGTPQQGELLVGYETEAQQATGHWIDSWHMGDKVMACRGTLGAQGALTLLGSFSAPPGPDWGWRIALGFTVSNVIDLTMITISPDGEATPAVEAHYVPASK